MSSRRSFLDQIYNTQVSGFTPDNTARRQGLALGDEYGLNYDAESIRGVYDNRTGAEFAAKRDLQNANEGQLSDTMFAMQSNSAAERRRFNDVVSRGGSIGTAKAAEFGALLMGQQESTMGVTEMAQQRAMLNNQEQEAYTQNVIQALTESNLLKQFIAAQDLQYYGLDTQFNMGQMDFYAQQDASLRGLQGMGVQSDAQVESAVHQRRGMEAQAEATKHAANQSLAAAQAQNPDFMTMYDERLKAGDIHGAANILAAYSNTPIKSAQGQAQSHWDALNGPGAPDSIFTYFNQMELGVGAGQTSRPLMGGTQPNAFDWSRFSQPR